jgi:hypothetical protein
MQSRGGEVVRVATRAFLTGSGGQACNDSKWNGTDIEPGFYFALSHKCGRSERRRAWLRYFGPFQSQVEANFLASSALAMGLIEPGSSPGASAREPALDYPDFQSRQSLCALTGT